MAVAQFIDSSDFLFVEGDAPNQRPLLDDVCVEIVPPGFPGIAQVNVFTADATTTRMYMYSNSNCSYSISELLANIVL
jgi:hypothetical protein